MAIYNGTQKVKPSGIAKVYVGSQLVYQPAGPSGIVNKGDIVSFDAFGDGNQKRFRVLACTGNITKLLALSKYSTTYFDTGYRTVTFDNGSLGENYDSSLVDTAMTNYYNALAADVKAAIQDTTIVQTLWDYKNWNSSSISPLYFNQQKPNGNYYQSEYLSSHTVGTRKVYAIGYQDIAYYFNTTLIGGVINHANVDTMFELTSTTESDWPWLRDTRISGSSPQVYYWNKNSGWIESYYSPSYRQASNYPVFSIDLSQIQYTVEN